MIQEHKEKSDMGESFRVSPEQLAAWRGERDSSGRLAVWAIVEVGGVADIQAIKNMLQELIREHEILRTVIGRLFESAEPVQKVLAPNFSEAISIPDRLLDVSADDWPSHVNDWLIGADSDLERRPFLYGFLANDGSAPPRILFLVNGTNGDVTTMLRLVATLDDMVDNHASHGERQIAPGAGLKYSQLVDWRWDCLRSDAFSVDREYWRALHMPVKPLRRLALERQYTRGVVRHRTVEGSFEPTTPGRLADVGCKLGCSTRALFMSSWLGLLWRFGAEPQCDVLLDGRREELLADVIGPLSKYIPFHAQIHANTKFDELAKQVHAMDREYRLREEFFDPESNNNHEIHPVAFEYIDCTAMSGSYRRLRICDINAVLHWFRLKLCIVAGTNSLAWRIWYDGRYFDEMAVQQLARSYRALFEAILTDPMARVQDLKILAGKEREELIGLSQGSQPGSSQDAKAGSVSEMFDFQASRNPNADAMVWNGGRLSYREVQCRVDALAGLIASRGVSTEQVVAIGTDLITNTIIAFLAVLKAGAAYVPIDIYGPPARTAQILAHVKPILAVSDVENMDLFAGIPTVQVPPSVSSDQRAVKIKKNPIGSEVAYVMYTSGSTGTPKGVAVTHGSLLHSTWARVDFYGPHQRFVLVTRWIYDSSVAGIYGTLCSGGTIFAPTEHVVRDPSELAKFIHEFRATFVLLVPTLYHLLLNVPGARGLLASLKAVIVAGEPCGMNVINTHRASLPETLLYNEYGPTEATVWTSVARLDGTVVDEEGGVSIGRAINGTELYLLDGNLEPVPMGVIGEIFIGGLNVARGYWRSPAQTALSFLPSPFKAGLRLYRTGDQGRRLATGEVTFIGRRDTQIKIRGYRIEIGEIEVALCRCLVGHVAVVLAVPILERGEVSLVGAVEASQPVDTNSIREELGQILPAHMVPEEILVLETLPRGPSGKIDRAACTLLVQEQRKIVMAADSPNSAIECALCVTWAQVLGAKTVGINDNFFQIGGHSLLAIRLLAQVRSRFGKEVRLQEFLKAPTVAGLAKYISNPENDDCTRPQQRLATPDPENRHRPFPLNSIQQAYWFGRHGNFQLGNVGTTNYFEFESSELRVDRLKFAVLQLVERHDMLRAVFHSDGTQQVLECPPALNIDVVDCRRLTPGEIEHCLAAVRERMARKSMQADKWPLFELLVHELPRTIRIHICIDLLICDATSARVLISDLYRLYMGMELPKLSFSFRDYVIAETKATEETDFDRAKRYWENKIPKLPPAPELPLGKDPSHISHPRFATLIGRLDAATWKKIKTRAQNFGVTSTAVLCAAYADVLAIWAKAPEFTLNLTTYARLPVHPDVDRLVGDFTSLTLLRIQSGEGPFIAQVRTLQNEIWGGLDHGRFGGVAVMRELRRLYRDSRRAMMPVVFTSQIGLDAPDAAADSDWLGKLVFSSGQAPQVWLDHQVAEREGGLDYWWDYLDDLFPPNLVKLMFDIFSRLLERLSDDEETWSAGARSIWIKDPATALLQRGMGEDLTKEMAGSEGWFRCGLLHEGFLRQAGVNPHAIALIWEDGEGVRREMDYARVRQLAWRVGCWLSSDREGENGDSNKGCHLIGVLLPKGWAQVVAVLGICWSGAAYVPLDISWPGSRVRNVLEQTGCRKVICSRKEAGRLGLEGYKCLWIDDLTEGKDDPDGRAIVESSKFEVLNLGPARSSDLAYIIFTSGSTGVPKGVMIDHGSACVTLAEVNRRWNLTASDRVLALSALSFDLSVFDIFGVLGAGGAVVMSVEGQRRDPAAWVRLARLGVTIWNSVPTLLQMAIEYLDGKKGAMGSNWPSPLRLVLLSGDWIPLSLPDRLKKWSPHASVISLGGATEASIWSIAFEVDAANEAERKSWRSIPYGKALAGQTVQVLRADAQADADLSPCPPWVTGQIYIGGAGLARGYWNDPQRTAQSFIFDKRSGERLYRTGDLGRYLPDGTIELLGREDHQVKIQGYRIELGEIESALAEHPDIRANAVRALDTPTGKRIVAYIVPRTTFAERMVEGAHHYKFKHANHGLRQFGAEILSIQLGDSVANQQRRASPFDRRRTTRRFAQSKLRRDDFGQWLHSLAIQRSNGALLRQYPSAGGLYPVQVYIAVRENRIDGLAAALYYYDPLQQVLFEVKPGWILAREDYHSINHDVYESAAFAAFIVGKLSAIEPIYGEQARDFCMLEAGCIVQLLMTCAGDAGIGLCPIGGIQFERFRNKFECDSSHVLLHSLLGGAADECHERDEAKTRPLGIKRPQDEFIDSVRSHLQGRIPAYMVPSQYITISELPLTANGKIDREALNKLSSRPWTFTAAQLQTNFEKSVARIWEDLIGANGVGPNDDFFALGGDSLLAIRFTALVRAEFKIEMQITDLLVDTTVKKVAAFIEKRMQEKSDGVSDGAATDTDGRA